MDTQQFLISCLAAVVGFLGKSAWDMFWKTRETQRSIAFEKRVMFLERQLEEFFWPLYIRLQHDNVVWQKILDRQSDDQELAAVAHEIETKTIITNHAAIVELIRAKIHLAAGDENLETELLSYLRHVSLYQAIRGANIWNRDPLQFGEPYPANLFKVVELRTRELQVEYEKLLRLSGAA